LTVCFYEDEKYKQFLPLTLLRPVYTLRAGIAPLFKRIERQFKADSACLIARDQIAPLLSETFGDYPVNIIKHCEGDVLFVNGRVRDYGDLIELVDQSKISTIFANGEKIAAVLFKAESLKEFPTISTQKEYQELFNRESQSLPRSETSATLYKYCWDIMADIEPGIIADFELLKETFTSAGKTEIHRGAYLINRDNMLIGDGVEILPGAVIDASKGPVYLGDNVRIEPHSAVTGPCYIGPHSVVLAGKITGSSIGHACRIGGEVEESVFHAHVNKYHAGFIGHSYVGQWVNFGAMTTNSDLKNNYSSIRVTINDESIDTGSIKIGSFIGDHTKFGIGTLLTTGINIGICSNIFGGTLITDKEVPSFSWGSSAKYDRYNFEKVVETAQVVAQRRDVNLTDHEIRILQAIYTDSVTDDGVMKFGQD